MADRLKGKVALVTGAGSGIGRACCVMFAIEGAAVVGVDVNTTGLAETADLVTSVGWAMSAEVADLTDEESVEALFRAVSGRHGRVDVLHNCVGGSTRADAAVDEMSVDALNAVLTLEVRTMVLGSKYGIPLLRAAGGGSVINMASYVAFRGVSRIHAYSASKGAVASLTRAMAGTYARDGIRVNAVAPGIALTERAKQRIQDPNVVSGLTFDWEDYPFAMGAPEDIANVCLFLATDESKMVTGHVIMADGGLTAY